MSTSRPMRPLTTDVTIRRAGPGPGGWCDLVPGPGEPYQEPVPAGQSLACLWHLSDLHLCDAESPARMEYLDRFSDPDSPFRDLLGDVGTYRPQEILTVQVAAAMLDVVNAVTEGPVTGRPVDAVLLTGDLTDNAQSNELDWYCRLVEGGTISPRSGHPQLSSWVGATDPCTWDERYWHPDGPPAGVEPDLPTRRFGFPSMPGLVTAARRDVTSPGLPAPWISVHGNHDALLQGTVPADEDLRALAAGSQRVVGLAAGDLPAVAAEAIAPTGPARYVHAVSSPRRPIVPDPARALLGPTDFAHATRKGSPAERVRNYFSVDAGQVRVIALDTVNPHGGWQGSLDSDQLAWLVRTLHAARDQYVVVASHHPSPTLTNPYAPAGSLPRVLGPEVVAVLLAHRNVVAWIGGHVHHHAARRHGDDRHGFWELTTASLIDWPQQSRVVELIRVHDRGRPEIAIVSTVADHAGPIPWRAASLADPHGLASISRVLAANDYRLRGTSLRGLRLESSAAVRNTVWRLPDPMAS